MNPPIAPTRGSGLPRELVASPAFLLKKAGFKAKERLGAAFEPVGLGMVHHAVLALLAEQPSETQAMIADTLGLDRSHLVGVLDELEEQRLVERRRDPDDRRRQMVTLTQAGQRSLAQLRALAADVDAALLEPLSAAERKTLAELLGRILAPR